MTNYKSENFCNTALYFLSANTDVFLYLKHDCHTTLLIFKNVICHLVKINTWLKSTSNIS